MINGLKKKQNKKKQNYNLGDRLALEDQAQVIFKVVPSLSFKRILHDQKVLGEEIKTTDIWYHRYNIRRGPVSALKYMPFWRRSIYHSAFSVGNLHIEGLADGGKVKLDRTNDEVATKHVLHYGSDGLGLAPIIQVDGRRRSQYEYIESIYMGKTQIKTITALKEYVSDLLLSNKYREGTYSLSCHNCHYFVFQEMSFLLEKSTKDIKKIFEQAGITVPLYCPMSFKEEAEEVEEKENEKEKEVER